ncbi:MAG TPA: RNA polymerase sporulation sigma factor SigH [Mycobacteriales bacterium]|nr:RNA polymerase sporulation sigma factor SigH [Mycobacteriales bacterium]
MRRALRSAYADCELPRADPDLVEAARAGDDVAMAELLTRYRGLASSVARSYFIIGGDSGDVVQEGMIGLYKAIRDFQPDRGASFRGFAELCVTRQIITAVKAATRRKHDPLRSCLSLDAPTDVDADGGVLGDLIPAGRGTDPEEQALSAASIHRLQHYLAGTLSDLEVDVLQLLVDGRSYAEIAASVGRHTKAVDNAIQRLRRKIAQHLADENRSVPVSLAAARMS